VAVEPEVDGAAVEADDLVESVDGAVDADSAVDPIH